METKTKKTMNPGRYWEEKRRKYSAGPGIRCERINFMFLRDGSMVYDSHTFSSYWDALIDAVRNGGEDPDDMIALIFPEKIDHVPVKEKLMQAIQEDRDEKEKEYMDLVEFRKMCLGTSPSGLVNICGGDCFHCVKYMRHKRLSCQ